MVISNLIYKTFSKQQNLKESLKKSAINFLYMCIMYVFISVNSWCLIKVLFFLEKKKKIGANSTCECGWV